MKRQKKKREKFAVMPTFPASFPLYILKHSLLFLILYKPNPTFGALSRSLRLQLSECSANGIKLGTGRFVDVILVVKNVIAKLDVANCDFNLIDKTSCDAFPQCSVHIPHQPYSQAALQNEDRAKIQTFIEMTKKTMQKFDLWRIFSRLSREGTGRHRRNWRCGPSSPS